MNTQTQIEFQTASPINIEKLTSQNKRLYDFLLKGNRINCMSPDMYVLRIGYLNSRCSDLKNKYGIAIQSKFICVEFDGKSTTVKEYWIEVKTEIEKL